MSDTPSVREVIEESVETPEVEPEATKPEVEPKVEPEVEPKEEITEESFAEKGELEGKTPEELEEIYKAWNRAYTAKRQKETQELKDYQTKIADLEKKIKEQPVTPSVELKAEAVSYTHLTLPTKRIV